MADREDLVRQLEKANEELAFLREFYTLAPVEAKKSRARVRAEVDELVEAVDHLLGSVHDTGPEYWVAVDRLKEARARLKDRR